MHFLLFGLPRHGCYFVCVLLHYFVDIYAIISHRRFFSNYMHLILILITSASYSKDIIYYILQLEKVEQAQVIVCADMIQVSPMTPCKACKACVAFIVIVWFGGGFRVYC